MTDVKLQLEEQGFEDSKEYIKEHLAPVCSELGKLCDVFFSGKQVSNDRTSYSNGPGWNDVDVPVMKREIQKLTFCPGDYPKFKGEERRRVMLTVDSYATEGSQFRVIRDGVPVDLSGSSMGMNDGLQYEVYLNVPDESAEYWIQCKGKFVLKSFSLEVVYF